MNIETVRNNLKNTIAGKEELLKVYTDTKNNTWLDPVEKAIRAAVVAFLEININELNAILADVEKCAAKEKQ